MDSDSGDARFDRYYRRIQLGLRLLSHGARAQTACDWSGLTPDRLITLKRRWLRDAGDSLRGPAPTSFQPFFRSSVRLSHATVFASIHQALCQRSTPRGQSVGSATRRALCTAYEIFREWEPDADMEFDQAVLLARGAASSEDAAETPVFWEFFPETLRVLVSKYRRLMTVKSASATGPQNFCRQIYRQKIPLGANRRR